MKINAFIVNSAEETNECGLREPQGHRAIGLYDPESEIVEAIDEQNMTIAKIVSTRFLKFLGNQRLTLDEVNKLPRQEQRRLIKQFRENN